MRRAALNTILAICLLSPGARGADYSRDPPPPRVFGEILNRGAMARDVRDLYQEARLVKDSPDKLHDLAWMRRVKTMIAVLTCTDRRVDADFIAGRILEGMHKRRPRDLFEVADLYTLRGFIELSQGYRVRGEVYLRQAVAYGNRNRGERLEQNARDAYFLAGLLRALDYEFFGRILDDQGKAFENMRRRRFGGTRLIRSSPSHERVPAMIFRTLKDELIQVDRARIALEDSQRMLPQVRSVSARADVSRDEYQKFEDQVLEMVSRLAERRVYMKGFLFQLRRSSDLKVMNLRDDNLADFIQLRDDLQGQAQTLLSHLLLTRFHNSL